MSGHKRWGFKGEIEVENPVKVRNVAGQIFETEIDENGLVLKYS
jgi:hypothetical protein